MNHKEKAGHETGPKSYCGSILSGLVAAIKASVVTLALWHALPVRLADWLIRRLRIGGA